MSGHALAFGPCCACNQVFGFNPRWVPSIRIEGEREPICRTCLEIANQRRIQAGLEPHPIHPDAYAPIAESEL